MYNSTSSNYSYFYFLKKYIDFHINEGNELKVLDIKNFSHLNNKTLNLNDSFFSINKKHKINKKILIISGGSRNGNHLITSILDGHPQLPTLPGEDKFLSSVFWNFFLNKGKIFWILYFVINRSAVRIRAGAPSLNNLSINIKSKFNLNLSLQKLHC